MDIMDHTTILSQMEMNDSLLKEFFLASMSFLKTNIFLFELHKKCLFPENFIQYEFYYQKTVASVLLFSRAH